MGYDTFRLTYPFANLKDVINVKNIAAFARITRSFPVMGRTKIEGIFMDTRGDQIPKEIINQDVAPEDSRVFFVDNLADLQELYAFC